jgi:hypothetical protein
MGRRFSHIPGWKIAGNRIKTVGHGMPCPYLWRFKMGFTDIIWMVSIIGGALYLLYRSIWKKKGHCQGCDSGGCSAGKKSGYGKC